MNKALKVIIALIFTIIIAMPNRAMASEPLNYSAVLKASISTSSYLCVRRGTNQKELLDEKLNVVNIIKCQNQTLTYKKVKVKKVKSYGFTKDGRPVFQKKNNLYCFKGKKTKKLAVDVKEIIFNDRNFAVKYILNNGETIFF